jgi:hypothetical protein
MGTPFKLLSFFSPQLTVYSPPPYIYIYIYVYIGLPISCQEGTEVGRGMALPTLDPGPRSGWVFTAAPQPLYLCERDQAPTVQEVGWASAPGWMHPGNVACIGGSSEPQAIQPVASRYTNYTIPVMYIN